MKLSLPQVVCCAVFAQSLLSAQSLQVLPSPLSGDAGEFRVMLATPPEKAVAAVQWRLTAPAGVTISANEIQPALSATEKILSCGPLTSDASNSGTAMICVVAGGVATIPNGPVAVVPFTAIRGSVDLVVRLDAILGATPDAWPVSFPDATGTVAAAALTPKPKR